MSRQTNRTLLKFRGATPSRWSDLLNSLASAARWSGLALLILIPSTGTIQKYLGTPATGLYLMLGFSGLLFVRKLVALGWLKRVASRHVTALTVVTFLSVAILFLILYPRAQAGIIGGGSDADDGLNVAANELLHGRYPYYARTYLDNAISPLPGAILLSIPFVLLGSSAYQNLFWLGVLFFLARSHLRSVRLSLLLIWTLLIFSPVVLQNIVTGSDYLSNSIYVLVFIVWMVTSIPDRKSRVWQKVVSSAVLGIGLASRSNFILFLPLLFSNLIQSVGWRVAIKYVAVTVAVLATVTIPFWLHDPQNFTPLFQQVKKVAEFRSVLPYSGVLIPVLSASIAVALSIQRIDRADEALFRNCAIVQAFPVFCLVILSSIISRRLNLLLTGYGVFALVFSAFAVWKGLVPNQNSLRQ